MADAGQVRDDNELTPEQQLRRRIALAEIRQYPDPALRLRAREVERFDADLERLVDRMLSLMEDAYGVGLAGNQVGVLQRVFTFVHEDEARAVVNPVIVERSPDTSVDDEGCLSMQGVLVPVERACSITLAGKDVHGGDQRFELSGVAARAAQHELDHLDGVLIIDRTTAERRREALATLRPRPVLSLR